MRVSDREAVNVITCIYCNYKAAIVDDSSHTEELGT
jgi:hypothetical protein